MKTRFTHVTIVFFFIIFMSGCNESSVSEDNNNPESDSKTSTHNTDYTFPLQSTTATVSMPDKNVAVDMFFIVHPFEEPEYSMYDHQLKAGGSKEVMMSAMRSIHARGSHILHFRFRPTETPPPYGGVADETYKKWHATYLDSALKLRDTTRELLMQFPTVLQVDNRKTKNLVMIIPFDSSKEFKSLENPWTHDPAIPTLTIMIPFTDTHGDMLLPNTKQSIKLYSQSMSTEAMSQLKPLFAPLQISTALRPPLQEIKAMRIETLQSLLRETSVIENPSEREKEALLYWEHLLKKTRSLKTQ